MTQEERDIRRKIKVLEHACSSGNVSRTCRYFGISRETYYCWRRRYQQDGEKGLVNRRPGPRNPALAYGPGDREKSPSPATYLSLRSATHRLVPTTVSRSGDLRRRCARHPHPAWTPKAAEYRQQTHDHGQTGREAVSKASTGAPRADRRQVSLLPWLN